MQLRRVVVTGMGVLTPIGNNLSAFLSALQTGQSGAGLITHFDTTKFKTKIACEIKGFDISEFYDRKEAKRFDVFAQYAMVAADEAVRNANFNDTLNKDRVGVIFSSGIGGLRMIEEEYSQYYKGDGTPRFSPFFIPKIISDIAAGQISMKYGYRGPNFSPVAACASSTIAIIEAVQLIQLGKADVIIAGGAEATITEGAIGGFNSMKALSERNDSPETASRPYDKDRDGFVMGEGAGALVIEAYEHAMARGATIHGEIIGTGLSADAYHLTAPHPDGLGAKIVMREVLRESGLQATDVDYINTHGTSTPLGDNSELKAIIDIFGDHAYALNISSTKSMTGHLLGAAGAVEAIACLLAMEHSFIPPTINHVTPDSDIDPRLNLTLNVAQHREINTALSNTFGFGGHNAAVLMRKMK
ncbi:MAG: beta-ketoacyl-ACP synthase II [Chitinophagales bacterium]|nr:beta-ketoacyl-ACP synthase II [Chitinophagales bacterium]